jgi:undecaprenyl-diphosphatase
VDTTLYLDVNRLTRATSWAHGAVRAYAIVGGLVVLALFVLLSALRARRDIAFEAPRRFTALIWTACGALVAVGIAQPVAHLVGREPPYVALHGVTVLVGRARDFSFPSDRAVFAGAALAGLWVSRDKLIALAATLAALLLAFAQIYVGAVYPGDVVGGLLLGAVVVLGGYPVASRVIRPAVTRLGRSPVGGLVGSARRTERVGAGPAAQPAMVGASGSVRLLSDHGARAVDPTDGDERRAVRSS